MKVSFSSILIVSLQFLGRNFANAFSVVPASPRSAVLPVRVLQSSTLAPQQQPATCLYSTSSDFDFPSAMPEKPQLTLAQRMEESADQFVETMNQALGEGVEAPPELAELQALRKDSSTTPEELAYKIYELMIERGMRYDEAPETGILTPTEFQIQENLDIKEVQDEFSHLYKYGMMLMDRGLMTPDQVKDTVLTRLIARTGLSPEEFDTWLGY